VESLNFEDLGVLDEPQLPSTAAQPSSPMVADTQLTVSTTLLLTHNSSAAALNPPTAAINPPTAATLPLPVSTVNSASLQTQLEFVAPRTQVASRGPTHFHARNTGSTPTVGVQQSSPTPAVHRLPVFENVTAQPHSPPVTPSRDRDMERALRLARIETALYLRDLDTSPSRPNQLAGLGNRDLPLDTSPSRPNQSTRLGNIRGPPPPYIPTDMLTPNSSPARTYITNHIYLSTPPPQPPQSHEG
jgi:hypothetical protein